MCYSSLGAHVLTRDRTVLSAIHTFKQQVELAIHVFTPKQQRILHFAITHFPSR